MSYSPAPQILNQWQVYFTDPEEFTDKVVDRMRNMMPCILQTKPESSPTTLLWCMQGLPLKAKNGTSTPREVRQNNSQLLEVIPRQ